MFSYVKTSAEAKTIQKRLMFAAPQKITIKDFYSVVIGLLPVIMMYKVPIWGKGLSTVLLGLFIPYVALKFCQTRKKGCWQMIIPALVCFGYYILKSRGNATNMFLLSVSLIHIICATKDTINFELTKKTVIAVALISAFCVFVQTVLHYILGIDIRFAIRSLIIDEMLSQYYDNAIETLYRPSGLFAEPSHMAQYSSMALAFVLFGKKEDIKTGVDYRIPLCLMLGVLLTTSGMGMAIFFILFFIYIILHSLSVGGARSVPTMIMWLLIAAVAVAVLFRIPLFKSSLARITGGGEYDAIWGRTLFYESTVGTMHGSELIWGKGAAAAKDLEEKYMTGFMQTVYYYGYVGYALLVFLFVAAFIKGRKKLFVQCVCGVYVGLLFVANLCGFISLCFWICTIFAAIYEETDNDIIIRQNIEPTGMQIDEKRTDKLRYVR